METVWKGNSSDTMRNFIDEYNFLEREGLPISSIKNTDPMCIGKQIIC